MSVRTVTRPLVLAVLLVAGYLVASAAYASAQVDPQPQDYLPPPSQVLATTAAPEGTPVLQYVLVAVVTCLVTLAATLVVQAMLRRPHGSHSIADA